MTYLRAAVEAVGAALLLARLERGHAFDQTVERLRRGRAFPPTLADPEVHLRVVSRLSPWLPPRGMGGCLKRSLLLLHLWTRCGLEPKLHIGVQGAVCDGFRGHAWLTATNGDVPIAAGGAAGSEEAFVF